MSMNSTASMLFALARQYVDRNTERELSLRAHNSYLFTYCFYHENINIKTTCYCNLQFYSVSTFMCSANNSLVIWEDSFEVSLNLV